MFGRNLFTSGGGGQATPIDDPAEEKQVQFVSFVLDDAQKMWTDKLPSQAGTPYRRAKLVLFRDSVSTACGSAQSAVGPFYCPGDEKVYIDLSFYEALQKKLGAPGDFAQAYVIAHEIGHHVQNVLGTSSKVHRDQRGKSETAANQLSVRLELQADCYAGVWAHSTNQRDLLEQGDIKEAMDAAAAVGDDRLQKMGRGHVNPDSFTHGSSESRMKWFNRGYESGDMRSCDTFNADEV